jgi:hypothetical protein
VQPPRKPNGELGTAVLFECGTTSSNPSSSSSESGELGRRFRERLYLGIDYSPVFALNPTQSWSFVVPGHCSPPQVFLLHIGDRLPYAFEEMGEQSIENTTSAKGAAGGFAARALFCEISAVLSSGEYRKPRTDQGYGARSGSG